VLTLKSLNAFMFFNKGFESGSSVLHKHMQVIPYKSLSSNILPVEVAAAEQRKEEGMFELDQFFGIKHRFFRFGFDYFSLIEEKGEEGINEAVEQIETIYHMCLGELGVDANDAEVSYNVYLTPTLLFVVLREKNSVFGENGEKVDVNTLGFTGTLAVKSATDLAFLKLVTPLEILRRVSKSNLNDGKPIF